MRLWRWYKKRAHTPRIRWYQNEGHGDVWQEASSGWLFSTILTGWGVEDILAGKSLGGAALKLALGIPLLIVMITWTLRPIRPKRGSGEDHVDGG